MNVTKTAVVMSVVLSLAIVGTLTYNEAEARELSIGPLQIEKLPEWKTDAVYDYEAIVKVRQIEKDNNGHNLLGEWHRTAWKTNFSLLGLSLPPESNPDTRDQSEYIRVYDGACWKNLELGDPVKIGCRQTLALAANEWGGYFAKDIGAMMYYHPTYTNWKLPIEANDVLHERAEMCSNPDSLWDRVYPPHHDMFGDTSELRDIIDQKKAVDTEMYIYLIENHLPDSYKQVMKHHILNGTYVDLETGETKLIHPNGVNCNLD